MSVRLPFRGLKKILVSQVGMGLLEVLALSAVVLITSVGISQSIFMTQRNIKQCNG